MPTASPLARALERLAAGEPLDFESTREAFGVVMAGEATPAAISALLLGIRAHGETADQLAGAVEALRVAMHRLVLPDPTRLVDTCGTGGGRVRTLNISTAAALVAAGAGVPIAKHGNRSFTSRSGSADVLEALDVPVDLPPDAARAVFDAAGLVFLFAPTYHPAMRHAASVRRELGVATIMNLVGPLANPAGVTRQVIGVADRRHGSLVAAALARLGAAHALVVHAAIGIDEIAPQGSTDIWEVRDGVIGEWCLDPADHGLDTPDMAGTEGGDPVENAQAIASLLEAPADAPIALRAAVLLNAAAAIYVAGTAPGFGPALDQARIALEQGAAAERLGQLRRAVAAVRTSG